MFTQTLVTGLAIGGIYALMAVGYSLVFSVLNFSNFAYGSIIMLGAYIGYYALTQMGFSLALSVIGSMIGAALLAFLNEKLAYSTLRKRNASSLYFMISAMGTAIFLENLVYATIGSRFYAFPEIVTRDNYICPWNIHGFFRRICYHFFFFRNLCIALLFTEH